jgi:23S rRNA pseudouridine1911/1915/1917 synthase
MSLNQGYRFHHVVHSTDSSLSVVAYMTERFPHSSQSEWATRIQAGEVLLDDVRAEPDIKVRAGSRLVWERPPWEEEPTPQEFTILYEDMHLVAVNKPSGLPTIPGGGEAVASTRKSDLRYCVVRTRQRYRLEVDR